MAALKPRVNDATDSHLKHLIIDSGAIIKGLAAGFAKSADEFWTVPAVISEIRDKKARHLLETLPFELKIREPNEKSLSFSISFARETGDLRSLSNVDLSVIALTVELEQQENGMVNINRKVKDKLLKKVLSGGRNKSDVGAISASATILERCSTESESIAKVEHKCVEMKDIDINNDGNSSSTNRQKLTKIPESNMVNGASDSSINDVHEEQSRCSSQFDDADSSENSSTDEHERHVSFSLPDEKLKGNKMDETMDFVNDDVNFPTLDSSSMSNLKFKLCTENPVACTTWSATVLAQRDKPLRHLKRVQHETANKHTISSLIPETINETQSIDESLGHVDTSMSKILNDVPITGTASDSEDDGIGWMSLENFSDLKRNGVPLPTFRDMPVQDSKPSEKCRKMMKQQNLCKSGCATTDFSMQNVLLQMGLPLISVDGMAIRNIRNWILRCAACFKTTTDMERLFCPVCGNSTLNKISCSIQADTGELRIHFSKKWKPVIRGTKFSLPKPGKGDRFQGDLLLREDQLLTGIWAQKSRRKVSNSGCMFGEHIEDSMGIKFNKKTADIIVGYGRKNPNCQRGRERRGKKAASNNKH